MLCTINLLAQSQLITIKLINKNNEPIIGANTALKERIDTNKVQFGSTDTSGIVMFNAKIGQQLFLIATFIGYKTLNQGMTVFDKKTITNLYWKNSQKY